MWYEIISVENGDVLSVFEDIDAGVAFLRKFVADNSPFWPTVREDVALIGIDKAEDEPTTVITWRDLVEPSEATPRFVRR